jgi:hypothetical protein
MPCFDSDGQLTTCGAVRERLTTEIRRLDDSMARMRETRELLVSALDSADSAPARG